MEITEKVQVEPEKTDVEVPAGEVTEVKADETKPEPEKPKVGSEEYTKNVQKAIGKVYSKEKAKNHKLLNELKQAKEEIRALKNTVRPAPPNPSNYTDSYGAVKPGYQEDLVRWKDQDDAWKQEQNQLKASEEEFEKNKMELARNFLDNAAPFIEKNPDFMQTISSQNIYSPNLELALYEHPRGHELAYLLGKNPAESIRISYLPIEDMYMELGKLEERLSSLNVKTSNAPSPISPVSEDSQTPSKSLDEIKDTKAWIEEFRRQKLKNRR